MPQAQHDAPIRLFSTCPPSSELARAAYVRRVTEVARWSERGGCTGILVYADNSILDPWLVSQLIIQATRSLSPLVAVQPVYAHPYTVAKIVTSFAHLYGRRLYLNMVAGGFKNDLVALNDTTPHDKRYDRLVEYTTIIKRLLSGGAPVDYAGQFYRVEKLRLTPPLPPERVPGIFVSGSSEAGVAAAKSLGATAIKYPKAPDEEDAALDEGAEYGIRVGIIAREGADEAWHIARSRFPEDRKGQLTHQLAMKVSDSVWHKELSELSRARDDPERNPYWLFPFENYKTFCPYLVGSYECVADEVARYVTVGYRTFILDVPTSPEEMEHVGVVFERAARRAAS